MCIVGEGLTSYVSLGLLVCIPLILHIKAKKVGKGAVYVSKGRS